MPTITRPPAAARAEARADRGRPAAVDLHVTELGEGPPLVVLHGLLGRARNWLGVARGLRHRRTVATADLRNHGASPWSEVMDYPAMAADVAALIEARGGGRADVLGHSMGGKVAMALALTRPELVGRLIVVDIAPVAYPQGYADLIRAMLAVDLAAVARRADADAALRAAVPDAALRGFLLQNLEPAEGGGFAWQPNLAVLLAAMPTLTGFPAELPAGRWEGPAFCLRGERSGYVGPDGEAALRRLLPRVELATVPGAGHWPHAERPADFLRLLEPRLG